MTYDYNDGFWYISGIDVYHVTSGGIVDVSVQFSGVTRLNSTRNGCCLYNPNTYMIKFVDYAAKAITKTWSSVSDRYNYFPGVFSLDISSQVEYQLAGIGIPASYDPVWGTAGSASWQEVSKDGYLLPKTKYHQVEVTLRGDATLEKIIMPPAIKIEDIQPQSYKNFYVKTDIPAGASVEDYETRLKVWFGQE
jgi:hypothetical protein